MPGKLTQEDFVRKSNEVHNGKYDYSLSEYTSGHAKVRIICPVHGEFEQRASAHMAGQGCPKCVKNAKVTQEACLARFREVHGDRYDYSLVRYVNNTTKVRIICRTHGEFEQTPAAHVNGQGCPRCVKNAPVDQAECLRRFREIHGDEYDYSLVRYVNKDKPVKIICRKHGAFLQSPANHWHGQGCPKCYGTGKLSTGEFIRRAREVHGDRYDYSQVEYVNNHTKVRIICPVHGVFEQVPMSHLKGINCPECGNAARKVPLSPEKMAGKLEKAKATWQAKYGVDNVMQVPDKVVKAFETRMENGCGPTSKLEDRCYAVLCDKFGERDVSRQYRSKRYPFPCDFYIRSLDLYVEMNLSWTHGGHFYDATDSADIDKVALWRSKDTDYYRNAIYTWTVRDVLKRNAAAVNNLNYLVFWDEHLKDFYEWLSQIA